MCENNEKLNIEVKESTFALAANRWSWIPLLGLIFFFVFTPLALLQLGKGRLGFYLIRRAFVKVVFLSALPIILLIYWAGLPEQYYPDMLLKKHGQYSLYIDGNREDLYYRFNILFRKIKYYSNSKIMEIENIKDGKRHGQYTLYHENGRKKLQIQYNMDSFDGLQTAWYENGQKEFEGKYKNDRYVGKWQGWYESGQQSWIAEYDEKGKQVGKYIVYHEDGTVALEGQFKNGKEVGKWTCYNDDGTIDWSVEDFSNNIQRSINSEYEYIVSSFTYDINGFTDIICIPIPKTKTMLPANVEWQIEPLKCDNEKMFVKILEEFRKKYIQKIAFGEIRDKIKARWFYHLKGLNITRLDLSDCYVVDDHLEQLQGSHLVELDVSNTSISSTGFSCLNRIFIEKLIMRDCKWFRDNDFKLLTVGTLNGLDLSHSEISDKVLSYLKDIKLNSLNLTGCDEISNEGIKYLNAMPLYELNLSGTAVNDKGLAQISSLPLNKLTINGNETITDFGIDILKKMKLKDLTLNYCDNFTNKELSSLKGLPIKSLDLFGCDNITDNDLKLLRDFPLRKLSLNYCPQITDKGIAFIKEIPLKKLGLEKTQITDAGLANLVGMPLEELDISETEITSDGLKYLNKLPLKKLSLANNFLIDTLSNGVKDKRSKLFQISKLRLNELDLGGTLIYKLLGETQINDRDLYYLRNMPLHVMHLYGCDITEKGLVQLIDFPLYKLNLEDCEKLPKKYRKTFYGYHQVKQMFEELSKEIELENKSPN